MPAKSRRLERSLAESAFVRVLRRGRRLEPTDGVVVGIGRRWLVVAADVDAGLAHIAMLRRRDVRALQPMPHSGFTQRAWQVEGHWPPPRIPELDLDGTGAMLRSIATSFPLLGLHYEYDDPNACFFGSPRRHRRGRVDLQLIDPSAEWDTLPYTLRHREISKVEVGSAYARRLLEIGGPPPPLAQ
jgi:hypothetical protein